MVNTVEWKGTEKEARSEKQAMLGIKFIGIEAWLVNSASMKWAGWGSKWMVWLMMELKYRNLKKLWNREWNNERIRSTGSMNRNNQIDNELYFWKYHRGVKSWVSLKRMVLQWRVRIPWLFTLITQNGGIFRSSISRLNPLHSEKPDNWYERTTRWHPTIEFRQNKVITTCCNTYWKEGLVNTVRPIIRYSR